MFFGHIDEFWKRHEAQIKKNACRNANLGLFSYLKICVYDVF